VYVEVFAKSLRCGEEPLVVTLLVESYIKRFN